MSDDGKRISRSKLVLLALVVILIIDIVVRLGMTRYAGFFEPDGFFHYAVISYAITHGLAIPATLNLSGFPVHNPVSETEGFYYLTIVPWLLLGKSLSYYTIMRYIPVLFGILDALGAFFLARYLIKSNTIGLLAAFFVAVSNGDISRTAALVYRGDGFSTIFVIVSMIFLIKGLQSLNAEGSSIRLKRVVAYGIGSAFMLSFASALWNGAPYAEITYMLAIILVVVYGFVSARKELLKGTVLLTLTFFLDYLLVHAYMAVKIIRADQALTSPNYFLFYLPVLAAGLIAWAIVANKDKMAGLAGSAKTRAYFMTALLVIGTLAVLVIGGSYISKVASGGGLVIAQNGLTETIQELQKPTFGFLFDSFMLQLFIGPIGIALFFLFSRRIENNDMALEGQHRWIGTRMSTAFLVLLAYLATTLYLQLNAVRFNSLLAVPLAVFSAYGVYGVYVLVRDIKKKGIWLKYAAIGIIFAIVIYAVVFSYISSMESVQADGINSQFLSAMSWMRNNTPAGATVLALWPDGSVVEGWAHRTSLMDSVGGQSSTLIYNFSRFLFNSTFNSTYFYKAGKPDYVVARPYWLAEISGIAQEGNITGNAAAPYGYTLMSSYNKKTEGNATVYTFTTSNANLQINGAALIVNRTASGAENATAYVHTNSSTQYYRIANIIFYNITSMKAQLLSASSSLKLPNYTLMLFYSGLNISGATVLMPSLPESNLFKLIYTCASSGTCIYTGPDGNVTLSLAYINSDTRIYKATYS